MEKKYKRPYSRQCSREDARRENSLSSLAEALQRWRTSNAPEQKIDQLLQLWRNWEMVMGPYLAPSALPLGHREGILIIGAEDHFMLQELSYSTPEILERVNAFMGEESFHKVELRLLQGKTPLNQVRLTDFSPPAPPEKPEKLGGLMGLLNPSSPVGRCYAAYVRMFERLDKEQD